MGKDIRDQIIEVTETYLGTPYGTGKGELDCNELARAVFRKFGYELGDPSSEDGRDLYNKGLAEKIAASLTVAEVVKKLKKGMLVFWSSTKAPSSRFLKIHHVSIYDEDGYSYEASSSKGKTVRRSLWESSQWQIVLIADVVSLLTPLSDGGTDTTDESGASYTRSIKYSYKTTGNVNFRKTPDTKEKPYLTFRKGIVLTYLGQEGDWIKVHYDDKIGYVHKSYVKAMSVMSVGDDIKAVQTRLKDLGYYKGSIDGKCGPKTAEAIVAYQIAKDLEVDGICGLKTWASLFA